MFISKLTTQLKGKEVNHNKMALSTQDREEISLTIRTVVNGNIKRVEEKLDNHIENHDKAFEDVFKTLEPVVEGVQWINTTRKFSLWVAGFVVAIAGAVTIFK